MVVGRKSRPFASLRYWDSGFFKFSVTLRKYSSSI